MTAVPIPAVAPLRRRSIGSDAFVIERILSRGASGRSFLVHNALNGPDALAQQELTNRHVDELLSAAAQREQEERMHSVAKATTLKIMGYGPNAHADRLDAMSNPEFLRHLRTVTNRGQVFSATAVNHAVASFNRRAKRTNGLPPPLPAREDAAWEAAVLRGQGYTIGMTRFDCE